MKKRIILIAVTLIFACLMILFFQRKEEVKSNNLKIFFPSYTNIYDDYKTAHEESIKTGKPLLILFTSYNFRTNIRDQVFKFINHKEVRKLLEEKYIFVCLLVDSPKKLSKADSLIYGGFADKGELWSDFLIQKFKQNAIPTIFIEYTNDKFRAVDTNYLKNLEDFLTKIK
ncbi:thioredoxin family protein [Emticicia agri]|uniref:Thioredoxin-like fold domain-containing protein n=1 Tax=Emticicia agri TaxID=2492393 RepID=A0A4V1ZCU3_9BACT|nr:thioredoxin family protein [Emticicia agri]RYU93860.1 hypothetical protein EWM59_19665 [Emticicia agri]